MKFLKKTPYSVLLPAAILLGLAPFSPQPHLLEKVGMLLEGTLSRPIDIFDLFMHGTPVLLLLLKALTEKRGEAS